MYKYEFYTAPGIELPTMGNVASFVSRTSSSQQKPPAHTASVQDERPSLLFFLCRQDMITSVQGKGGEHISKTSKQEGQTIEKGQSATRNKRCYSCIPVPTS